MREMESCPAQVAINLRGWLFLAAPIKHHLDVAPPPATTMSEGSPPLKFFN
ncbi:hypothetical protein METH_19655 [Leisingera methylohalidivorans DSM 14336]|uniref:Uncharacterized protein n=1 Tax=Leisingera methylohalidivorans DSM 14336 TaxID=999552 RepID=V9W288_9RHOB|nr:hypothetical protein METH_19655 [Leisingera methylohalidivorans DSM 14336]